MYGESANADGEALFESYLNRALELEQPSSSKAVDSETPPPGFASDVHHPTLSVFSTDAAVINAVHEVAVTGDVALSINVASGMSVRKSAAFSGFHGTGGKPAPNRVHVVQSGLHPC